MLSKIKNWYIGEDITDAVVTERNANSDLLWIPSHIIRKRSPSSECVHALVDYVADQWKSDPKWIIVTIISVIALIIAVVK